MERFEIIEADFQQFYNLDVSTIGFQRYARLLVNLPPESRFAQAMSPIREWDWDKEVQSRILQTLDALAVMYANAHRKKGSTPLKVGEQFQPDYVKAGKAELRHGKREELKARQDELAAIFEERNKHLKKMEDAANGAQDRGILRRERAKEHNKRPRAPKNRGGSDGKKTGRSKGRIPTELRVRGRVRAQEGRHEQQT